MLFPPVQITIPNSRLLYSIIVSTCYLDVFYIIPTIKSKKTEFVVSHPKNLLYPLSSSSYFTQTVFMFTKIKDIGVILDF